MVAMLAKQRENEPLSLEALRSRLLQSARNFDVAHLDQSSSSSGNKRNDLDWPELADILPDGAFPRGVVELASPYALGGSTAVAFAAVRSAQKRETDSNAIPVAWIDTDATLFAPGAASAGVDLARLFVVRPPRAELGRIAVKVARSGAFDLLVVDMDPIPGACAPVSNMGAMFAGIPEKQAQLASSKMEVVVRKLALAAEENGMTVILITDARRHRAVPWPVAMRLELERHPGKIGVRVAKERHGRIGSKAWLSLESAQSKQAELRAGV
jgi:RecA/RadA recombinase